MRYAVFLYGRTWKALYFWIADTLLEDLGAVVILALLLLVDAILVGVGLAYHAARRRRNIRAYCRKCGYKLRGNASNVCPECGTPMPPICFPPIRHPRELSVPSDKGPRGAL
ncbi:MAG: hypothetical protein JXQ73_20630 [Phycisphaerae bacterium]|nr:hypothetical protein [Phycisphaerae bacterium]